MASTVNIATTMCCTSILATSGICSQLAPYAANCTLGALHCPGGLCTQVRYAKNKHIQRSRSSRLNDAHARCVFLLHFSLDSCAQEPLLALNHSQWLGWRCCHSVVALASDSYRPSSCNRRTYVCSDTSRVQPCSPGRFCPSLKTAGRKSRVLGHYGSRYQVLAIPVAAASEQPRVGSEVTLILTQVKSVAGTSPLPQETELVLTYRICRHGYILGRRGRSRNT